MALSQGLLRVYLGLSEVAFIEGCPHVRGGLYEGLHCTLELSYNYTPDTFFFTAVLFNARFDAQRGIITSLQTYPIQTQTVNFGPSRPGLGWD